MELEGEVQGRQDQAQKIIDMPQRDQGTSTSENQPSSARWSPCMGRKGLVKVVGIRLVFLVSISNWQEHLGPRLFNCGRNWCWQ